MGTGVHNRWASAFISFVAPGIYGEEADDVIRLVVRPIVESCRERNLIAGYFFVRYGQWAPHIRLRVLPSSVSDLDEVSATVERVVRASSPHATMGRFGTGVPEVQGTPHPGTIADLTWVEYEPEVQRYGGPEAIAVAERFFEDSSAAALSVLHVPFANRSARLGRALLQMLIVCHSFTRSAPGVADLCGFFSSAYLPQLARVYGASSSGLAEAFRSGFERQSDALLGYLVQALDDLDAGTPLGEPLDGLASATQRRVRELADLTTRGAVVVNGTPCLTMTTATRALAPSYLHMLCNRIGVTMPEEAYLANLILRSLHSGGVIA